jgi:3-oxoacyl-[acyl-carrier protein] reductase
MAALQNKTALVTGASRGIGRATATALAEAGAHVLVHYGRSKLEAESLVAEIQRKGGRADAVSSDHSPSESRKHRNRPEHVRGLF